MFNFTCRPTSCTIRYPNSWNIPHSSLFLIYHNPHYGRLFWDSHCLTFFHCHFHLTAPSNSSYNSQFCKLVLPYYRILHVMHVPLCAYSIYMTMFRQATPYVLTHIYPYSVQHFLVCAAHGTNVNSESNWVSFVCRPTVFQAKFRYSALNCTKTASFHILFNSLATLNQPFGTV